MALIKWNEDYELGISEIDKQHNGLVDILNSLFDAMQVGRGNSVLGQIITKLIDYASYHFATEEKYFDEFKYEESESHKEIHRQFAEKVVDFKRNFDAGNVTMTIDVFAFLKQWLKDHILDDDRKYQKCFKENGLR